MPDYRLSADESALLAVIPANGTTIGNGKARQNLDWEEERYWVARDALVDRGLIARGVGRGGTVFRLAEMAPANEVTVTVPVASIDEAASIAARVAQREEGLYSPLAEVIRGAWS